MSSKPRVAVVGGGIGGTTAAILLQRAGYECKVYEQASAHARVGAGINLAPNSTRIFRELGLEPQMKKVGIQPKLAQSLARHSDIRLTLGVYTHVGVKECYLAIGNLPSPVGKVG